MRRRIQNLDEKRCDLTQEISLHELFAKDGTPTTQTYLDI